MKTDKKPIIGFICVMLSCILVIGITIGLLSSANNKVAAGALSDTTADTTDKSAQDTVAEPPVDDPELKPELEWGFGSENGWHGSPGCMAYSSKTNTFDVEDVKLSIYYGETFYDIDFCREYGHNIPVFNIACANQETYDQYVIKEVNENFVSDEYNIEKIYDEKFESLQKVIYNHSEEIVIPKEVFQGRKGTIALFIWGFNVNVPSGKDPQYMILAYTADIKYEMIGSSKVILSPVD